MKPKSDKIFIEPIDDPVSKVITGLIIPPKYKYKSREFYKGRVIAKGPKVDVVEVGDEVAYHKDFGLQVELDDKKFVVIRKNHILAVA